MLNDMRINKINRVLLVIFFSLQPVLQLLLDLFEDRALAVFGISVATIIRYSLFGIISFLAVIANINKKSTKFFIGYILLCGIYIVVYYINTRNFSYSDYYGSWEKGFVECAMDASRYILPICLILIVYILKPSYRQIKISVFIAVAFVVLQLLVTNLFGIDRISYQYGSSANPNGNIISWFSNNINTDNWRMYTSRGLYSSGNALSEFFSLLLPMTIFIAFKEGKIWIYALVVFEMISMLMIGTRVSVYGVILIFGAVLCIWIFHLIFNKKKFSVKRLCSIFSILLVFSIFFTYSPFISRIRNGEGSISDGTVNDLMIDDELLSSFEGEDLENDTTVEQQKDDKTKFIRENFASQFIPYGLVFNVYDYREHTDFWYDLLTKVEFSKRSNARKIKALILNDIVETKGGVLDRVVGIGQMGIYPEADIDAIYYYHGILGLVLFVLPYIAVLIWSAIKCLISLYKHNFEPFNYVLVLSLGFILITAFVAGHTLSLAHINSFIGLICGVLLISSNSGAKTEAKTDKI